MKNTPKTNHSINYPINYNGLQKTAIQAAHASGKVLMKYFRKKITVNVKPDLGLVTNADIESEKAALKVLKKGFPDFGVLTEESAAQKGTSPGTWILDPLDGTTNYAHGLPLFCVSIAAEWKGELVVGVVYHPVTRETFTAIRGKGAYLNGKRICVSSTRKLKDAFLSTGFTSNKDAHLTHELEAFERLSRATQGVRRPGAAALDLANVARGVFDGFWEMGLAPWDVAAGSLLIHEAGGKTTNFAGNRLILDGQQVLASNGFIHLDFVKEVSSTVSAAERDSAQI